MSATATFVPVYFEKMESSVFVASGVPPFTSYARTENRAVVLLSSATVAARLEVLAAAEDNVNAACAAKQRKPISRERMEVDWLARATERLPPADGSCRFQFSRSKYIPHYQALASAPPGSTQLALNAVEGG